VLARQRPRMMRVMTWWESSSRVRWMASASRLSASKVVSLLMERLRVSAGKIPGSIPRTARCR
jgi:hypothetical protein